VIRHAYLDFLKNNPWYAVELFAYYKPHRLWWHFEQMVAAVPPAAWALSGISVVAGACLIGTGAAGWCVALLLGLAVLYPCSLAPSFWAYPGFITMADQVWSNLFLGIALITGAIAAAIRWRLRGRLSRE
jgi:uncharacterized membrane protein YphA (DoxX/SURF4 family)